MRLIWIACILLLSGCSEPDEYDTSILPKDNAKTDPLEGLPLNEAINSHIKSKLQTSPREKYTFEIFKGDCDGDDSLDMIITVNLLDRALTQAMASGQLPKHASTGYMGHFNYFIYVDGLTRKFDDPKVVPSSPHAKLLVKFEQIRSANHMDFTVDYRIKDSGYRDYYTVFNGHPVHILQTPLFSGIGESTSEAFRVRYETGSYSTSKDIVVYKGTFDNIVPTDEYEIYSFVPKIIGTDKQVRRWFFNERDFKYYTMKEQ